MIKEDSSERLELAFTMIFPTPLVFAPSKIPSAAALITLCVVLRLIMGLPPSIRFLILLLSHYLIIF
jgi:hypothetical protein